MVFFSPQSPPIPFRSIVKSLPFYAILFAHMGHNYGYETLMTELPTYMKQVLRFSLKSNGLLSSLPYLAMWLLSMFISVIADWMISSKRFSLTATRKIINSIGQYGPGLALIAASYTGCDRALTLAILTIGVGLNGGIYSGFKINHLDLTPRFAGFLMSITNCSANLAGLLAPIAAGNLISDPSKVSFQLQTPSSPLLTSCSMFTACDGSVADRVLHRCLCVHHLRYLLQHLRLWRAPVLGQSLRGRAEASPGVQQHHQPTKAEQRQFGAAGHLQLLGSPAVVLAVVVRYCTIYNMNV